MNQSLINLSKDFVTQFYTTMQQDKAKLINFYGANSTMTYGGDYFSGIKQIEEKIESLGFQKITFKLDHLDAQGGPVQGSFLIFVSGAVCMDDTDNYKFSQVFFIMPNNSGGYYVHNDIFTFVI